MTGTIPSLRPETCTRCGKLKHLCVCEKLEEFETALHVLILQHPQEPDHELGSARLASLMLRNSTLKIGLSWASLKSALGRDASPARWAVLYLGSGIKPTSGKLTDSGGPTFQLVTKKGELLPPDLEKTARKGMEGIVVLDGTWSQAKALWWRNPWLLKLRRAVLTPSKPSLYRELRKEPRRECLSTIESIAESLQALGEPREVSDGLRQVFQSLLSRKRERR